MLAYAESLEFINFANDSGGEEGGTKSFEEYNEGLQQSFEIYYSDVLRLVELFEEEKFLDLFNDEDEAEIVKTAKEIMSYDSELKSDDVIACLIPCLLGYNLDDVLEIYDKNPIYVEFMDRYLNLEDLAYRYFDDERVDDGEEFVNFFKEYFKTDPNEMVTKWRPDEGWCDDGYTEEEIKEQNRFDEFHRILTDLGLLNIDKEYRSPSYTSDANSSNY